MANPLAHVRPTEDWASPRQGATYSATSEQVTYEAAFAGTDDPSEPWWANSGTATLTVNLGASREVGLIALIATNADAAKVITIAGGITGSPTLTGARYESGYPKDLYYTVEPAQTLTQVTFAISGNTNKWSIGKVVIGKRRTVGRNFVVGGYTPAPSRLQFSDENDFGHDIRYDLGVERWMVSGDLHLSHDTDLATLDDWWSSTKGGYYPTLVTPVLSPYPPMFARFANSLPRDYYAARLAQVSLTFMEVSKGLEVVG